ncbi:olfactory receptor 1G1-like [Ambystoma mexicanum]|uniref:olfactory receptor 1G1-like n=1 Tax=Ambystoma mexicanum TaxID=8296 RepID=UPI0037E8E7CC
MVRVGALLDGTSQPHKNGAGCGGDAELTAPTRDEELKNGLEMLGSRWSKGMQPQMVSSTRRCKVRGNAPVKASLFQIDDVLDQGFRKLTQYEQNYTIPERDLLAVVLKSLQRCISPLMAGINWTIAESFLIVGFSDFPLLKIPLFVTFLLVYLITLVGNILIMTLIYTRPRLHTPMYFFLRNLSFIDISCTSVIFPQMLAHFFLQGAHISLNECLLQVYFFILLVAAEFLLLTAMAYDRYVAICNPLRYLTIMNKAVCVRLATGSWVTGIMTPIIHTLLMSRFSYCASHTINHFFCDVRLLLKLSCSSTYTIEIVGYIVGSALGLVPFALIIASYVKILSAILRIPSTQGRQKAFSTCASHLAVVILFYMSLCSTYMQPKTTHSVKGSKILALLYTSLTPLCNPIIYSLKNTEIKNALKKKTNTK